MAVGIEKKMKKFSEWSACFFEPMVVRMVGAMIKYPHTKKNAQAYKRALYPGLTTVSLDRIINL